LPPISKPEPHKRVKARNARQHAAARKIAVDFTWKRAEGCCEICGRWVERPQNTMDPFGVGHVDEIVPRSLGGSDTDTDNLRLLCHYHHFPGPSGAHRKTVRH
jgi:hypothetical protein